MRRRRWLAAVSHLAGGALLLPAVRCAPRPGKPSLPAVPLEDLADGRRAQLTVRGEPLEVFRDGNAIVARSLLCSHVGCVVKWEAEQGLYLCPCHEGVFDAAGQVVSGPPPSPLEEFATRVEGDRVLVETG